MSFSDQLVTDMGTFFNTDEFAQDVIYNDGSGPVTILAIVGEIEAGQSLITVKLSDVENPEYRQTFIIDSDTWYIVADKDRGIKIDGDNGILTIPIAKNPRMTQWRK